MNWFPFYSADFLGATVGLSYLERCSYGLMLIMYYELERPLPPDKTRCYRLLHCESDEQRRAVDHVLAEFFILREDGWYNKRAEKELARIRVISGKRAESGAKGAKARWNNEEEMAIAKQVSSNCIANATTPTPTVTPTPTESQKSARPLRGTRLPTDWIPGPEGTEFCNEERPDLNASEVLMRFRDYWHAQPGQKGVKVDWMATWRNWVRREGVRG